MSNPSSNQRTKPECGRPEQAIPCLPCPFCGGGKLAIHGICGERRYGYIVVCVPCDAEGPVRKTRRGAQVAWNRRVK